MVRRRAFVAVLATATASVLIAIPPAHAGDPESEFVARINAERSSHGLRTLAVRSDLIAVARNHSHRMASQGQIYHNPNLQGEVSNWKTVAENVGRGGSARDIHEALMDSPSHRHNILYPSVTEVGVGVAWRGNKMYVTQIFREPMRASSPPPPRAPSVSVPQPTYPPAVVAPVREVRVPDPAPRTMRMLTLIVGIH